MMTDLLLKPTRLHGRSKRKMPKETQQVLNQNVKLLRQRLLKRPSNRPQLRQQLKKLPESLIWASSRSSLRPPGPELRLIRPNANSQRSTPLSSGRLM